MAQVPFYSQMVNWNGEDSGFPSDAQVRKWESNCCGIACARMVIDYYTGVKARYWDVLQRGLQLGAYNTVGWIHKGVVDLVGEYGVEGKAYRERSVEELFGSVRGGNVCIVSISVGFRGGLKKKDSEEVFGKGGHLVVAFLNDQGEITCHHPSSLADWNKPNWVVPEDPWKKSFSGGFMEFRMKKNRN